jgi:hypothetical protein
MERVLDSFKKYSNIEVIEKEENFESYTLSFKLSKVEKDLEWYDLDEFSSLLNTRDRATLNISVNEGDPFSFTLNDNHQDYLPILGSLNRIIDEESIIAIEYKVSKKKVDSTVSIYNLGSFYTFLSTAKFMHLIHHFHKHISISSFNKFEIQFDKNEKVYFQSPIMIIGTRRKLIGTNVVPNQELREKILNNRLLNTNPQLFAKFKFIPNDFHDLRTVNDDSNEILSILNKFKIVYAASFLSNISNIDNDNKIILGIIGHKYIESTADFNNLDNSQAQSFYSIYEWTFESSDVHDKLDLARNMITRYFIFFENKWMLPHDTLSSIQSAHAIYLKENVEKYIETKNKVAEITTELSLKSKDVAQHFISSFKNNNLTLLTYFISIFIFNSLSDNSDKKIFSLEKYYLSMFFLFISCVYLLITRVQIYKDIKLNIRYFYSMKRIYRDIFDNKELNTLFHKRHLQYNTTSIKQTMDLYSWICVTVK